MRPITPHTDPIVSRLLAAHDKVQSYDLEFRRLCAELRASGRDAMEAEELAKKALRESAPSETERYDSIRGTVLVQQMAKREASVNPALDAMSITRGRR